MEQKETYLTVLEYNERKLKEFFNDKTELTIYQKVIEFNKKLDVLLKHVWKN